MKIYRSVGLFKKKIDEIKKSGKTIGFVPTMGSLHEGHLSLIRKAKLETDFCVVSIFVNPTQFGPKEDFKKYPRDLKKDISMCRDVMADVLFIPAVSMMYRDDFSTYVTVDGLSKKLCGISRPYHFRGVATIVLKFFNLVKPDVAYFGQKDAQQVIIIKKMVRDLDVSTKIKVMPIIREKDGLAMSSRNKYLTSIERKKALVLYESLKLARSLYKSKEKKAFYIKGKMRKLILKEKGINIDYISIVDPDSLNEADKIGKNTLILVAARLGKTRLIDNIVIK
ncbi:MAG: pantoate--beta-alanine ligase [Candidatus Omnitrophota bacterium]